MPSLAHEIMKDSSSAIFVALKKESWTYQGEQVKVYESGSLSKEYNIHIRVQET